MSGRRCSRILVVKPLLISSFANIFSQSTGCLFTLFMVSYGFPDSSVGKKSALNVRDPSLIPVSGRSAGEGLPCDSAGKESACNVGDLGSDPWVGKITWRRERPLTPVFWPGEFDGL